VFSVGGSLTGDKTFAGEDTITAIHEEEESTALAAQSRDTGSGTEEKEYTFSLDKHFTSNVRITSAFLWVKSSGRGQAQSKEARMYKTHRNWETVVGRLCDLTCSSLKRGNGYEWDLTSRVRGDWEQGIFDVVVRLCDEESGRRPMLVVVYEDGTATTEEAFCQQQSLQPMGSRINLPDGNRDPGETLTLCYTESDIQGVAENDLNLYYWDATAIKWEPVPESTKNTVDNTFTCQAKYGRSYQIMAPRSAMTAQTGAGGTNSLGQNYPNPFNPATTIEYAIAKDCHVTLKLYNTAGELVAVMVDEYQQAGAHSVYYDGGERLSRGIYFYQLVAGDFVDTRRMVVLK
jgi:hypothetical protein